MNAIVASMAAHPSVSRQALHPDANRAAMLATVLTRDGVWEAVRQRWDAAGHG